MIDRQLLEERRAGIIGEIKRISKKLNGKFITKRDFEQHAEGKGFQYCLDMCGGIEKLRMEAGLTKSKKLDFFQKREQLKITFSEIAKKYDNRLSYAIIQKELNKDSSYISHLLTTYFNGLKNLVEELGVVLDKHSAAKKNKFTAEQSREHLKTQLLLIAKKNNNILSNPAIHASLPNLSPINLNLKIMYYFGGLPKFCEENKIKYSGFRSINANITELEILKDIKKVSRLEGAIMTESFYRLNGKFALTAVEQYYGTFKKACEEINVKVVK